MNVRVTKRAQAQIDRAAEWWDQNRDLAPEAFDEDLAKAFSLLGMQPGVGAPVVSARTRDVRRPHTRFATAINPQRMTPWPST